MSFHLVQEWKFAKVIWKKGLLSSAQLRGSFLIQIFGMILNNSSFIIIWLLFFQVFQGVGGWSGWDMIGLQGFSMLVFGTTFLLFDGFLRLPTVVENGYFDVFLLSPRNLVLRSIVHEPLVSAIGDAIMGLCLLFLFMIGTDIGLLKLLWLFSFVIPAVCTTIGFGLLAGSVAFYLPDADNVTSNIFKSFLTPSLYPSVLFPDFWKGFFLFVIPSLMIGGFPVETILGMNITWASFIWIIGIGWLTLGILAFYRSVKRYESGNFLGIRT